MCALLVAASPQQFWRIFFFLETFWQTCVADPSWTAGPRLKAPMKTGPKTEVAPMLTACGRDYWSATMIDLHKSPAGALLLHGQARHATIQLHHLALACRCQFCDPVSLSCLELLMKWILVEKKSRSWTKRQTYQSFSFINVKTT